MEIGEKIKYLRTRQGMTLEELGEKVGVGKSTVRKWETGAITNMRRNKIASLADALNVSPSYLMGWEEENNIDIDMDMSNNQGTISNNIGSDSSESNNTYTTTNNYYSSPCSQDQTIVNHDVYTSINSKELFFELLMVLKDMSDEQLKDMIRYGNFVLKG